MTQNFLTIAEAARLIKNKELSPVELTRHCLTRIDKFDKHLNSFICVLSNEAIRFARKAEKEIMAGEYKSSLHGITIGLKDVYETAGIPTTAHSKILQNNIPQADAHSVKRLKQNGAIILGKLATHEFAFGGPSFDLPWPPARNPWDVSCHPGGSSSGTGAAVAAGFVLGGTASDTGGSIRIPAAYCGLAGIKPTYGLISRQGVMLLASTLDHAGVMAWTAEDCAILLQAMAGHDPDDTESANVLIPDYNAALTGEIKGIRVGLVRHFYTCDNEASIETRDAIDTAAKKLEQMGCTVEEIQLPPLFEWTACGNIIMLAEAFANHKNNLQKRFTDFGEVFRDRMALASLITAADYIHALQRRRELRKILDTKMNQLDVLLTATTLNSAPKLNTVNKFSIFEHPLLTIAFNLTGNPAMSVCCGYSKSGLPLSMQIIGNHFDEVTVLRIADAYEKSTEWRNRRPLLKL